MAGWGEEGSEGIDEYPHNNHASSMKYLNMKNESGTFLGQFVPPEPGPIRSFEEQWQTLLVHFGGQNAYINIKFDNSSNNLPSLNLDHFKWEFSVQATNVWKKIKKKNSEWLGIP